MRIQKIVLGGWCAGHRTYIISGVGIISAIAAYLVGDENLFTMMNSVFTLAGIYFLRKSTTTKRKKNGSPRKVSE
ncbi:MAG: hypothetical protein LBL75_02740 [Rickettsiales bacterium]|jgi:hypothetical protein|nr:hypothetical protein [Rickettsiales bacterium]